MKNLEIYDAYAISIPLGTCVRNMWTTPKGNTKMGQGPYILSFQSTRLQITEILQQKQTNTQYTTPRSLFSGAQHNKLQQTIVTLISKL